MHDSVHLLRKKLEELVVRELEKDLVGDKISGERAQEIAKIFLEAVPEDINDQELLTIIPTLDDNATELSGVVYTILAEKDHEHRTQQMDNLRQMIKGIKNG